MWWAIESYRCIAFSLASDIAQLTVRFHPLRGGHWKAESIRGNVDPELAIATRELEERLASTATQDAMRSAQYACAAARGARYRADSSFYEGIAAANAQELSEMGKWFPCPPGHSPLDVLRMTWIN